MATDSFYRWGNKELIPINSWLEWRNGEKGGKYRIRIVFSVSLKTALTERVKYNFKQKYLQ